MMLLIQIMLFIVGTIVLYIAISDIFHTLDKIKQGK